MTAGIKILDLKDETTWPDNNTYIILLIDGKLTKPLIFEILETSGLCMLYASAPNNVHYISENIEYYECDENGWVSAKCPPPETSSYMAYINDEESAESFQINALYWTGQDRWDNVSNCNYEFTVLYWKTLGPDPMLGQLGD